MKNTKNLTLKQKISNIKRYQTLQIKKYLSENKSVKSDDLIDIVADLSSKHYCDIYPEISCDEMFLISGHSVYKYNSKNPTCRIVLRRDDSDIDRMEADLEEFYECAGFADYYFKVLKNMTDDEIVKHWNETLNDCHDLATAV